MNKNIFFKNLKLLALALVAVTLIAGPSFAQTQLVAMPFEETLPDGATVEMWGFAADTGQDCPATPLPDWDVGPEIADHAAGTDLTIDLRNCLAESVSIVIPGQNALGATPVPFVDPEGRTRLRSFTDETAVGATVTYTWTNLKAGTYLYQSGTHPAKQVQMGLYGALVVDDGSYPGVAYDNEVTLLYSEIDLELHAPASGASPFNYKPEYFLINGAPYSAAQLPLPAGSVTEDLLIRFLNAGLKPHTPTILGGYLEVMAEDGNPYPYPRTQYSALLAPGKTLDAIWRPTTAGNHPVYDRALYLTSAGAPDGGMLAYLAVTDVAGVPVANAGPDQTAVAVGTTVTLDGNASSDPELDPLTYLWSFASLPMGSVAALSDPTAVAPTFVADPAGTYALDLVVNDGTSDSAPDSVLIFTNLPPVADAGPAQSVTIGDTVTLDGIGSSDPDLDTLTYLWSLTSKPIDSLAALSDPTDVGPTFVADVAGDYVVQLVVNDGALDSDPDTVTITAGVAVNVPPVAVDDAATTDRNVPVTIDLVFNDTDEDGTIDPTTVVVANTTATRGGEVVNHLNGTVTFTPKKNFRGTDTFTYTVQDDGGATSNVATVRVNVVRP
jgi:FtsP/CotA-like multicopper oxidase with cupredoxin domain